MINKHFALYLLLAVAVCQARADVILYDNTTTDTGYTDGFVANSLVEAGDEITLLNGSDALVDTAKIGLYNSSANSGSANVTLRLYSVSGSTLGSLLYTSPSASLSFSPTTNSYYTFTNVNTVVPSTVVWTLAYTTTDSISPELLDFDPPTVGTSDNQTAWWDTGTGLTLTNPGFNTQNYYFQLSGTSVPEPESSALLATGLTALVLWIRRQRRIA